MSFLIPLFFKIATQASQPCQQVTENFGVIYGAHISYKLRDIGRIIEYITNLAQPLDRRIVAKILFNDGKYIQSAGWRGQGQNPVDPFVT